MQTQHSKFWCTTALTCLVALSASAQEQTLDTRLGKLTFERDFPTAETARKMYDALDFQRAVQCFLWAYPVVSFESLQFGLQRDLGVDSYAVVIFDNFLDSKSLVLTGNTTTIYAVTTFDVGRDGPVVLDIPGGPTVGMVDDYWQRSLTDVGLAGPDKGQGGKFLIVPPGYTGELPGAGYHIVRAHNHSHNFLIRGLVVDNDKAGAVNRIRQLRIYPWSQRATPQPNKFVSGSGKAFDTLPASGLAYWVRLAAYINANPVAERDRFFMAMLKPLGIEKGKEFTPDARQRAILEEAATVGHAMAKTMLFDAESRFSGANIWPDTHWNWVVIMHPTQEAEHYSQLDERLHYYYGAIYMTPGMVPRKAGPGSQYVQTFRDKDGDYFDGAKAYHLRVPPTAPNGPAKDFWSVTIYDSATRSMVQNATNKTALTSYDTLQKNTDGSMDLYFGLQPPAGKESNWLQTVSGKGFYLMLRVYGPTEAFFDKTWRLPDAQKVQ